MLALLTTACCWSCVNVTAVPLCFDDKVTGLTVNGSPPKHRESGCTDLTFWPHSESEVEFFDSKGISRQFTLQRSGRFDDSAVLSVKGGSLHVWGGYDVNPKKPVTLPVVRYD